jgi:phosphoribosylformylglycinamidine (FGAM) synthase-like enzyme
VREGERAALMVELQRLASLRGGVERQLAAMDAYDFRRPEREAALAALSTSISVISRAIGNLDGTWIGGSRHLGD